MARVDENATLDKITCTDFTFDGLFDNSGTDGTGSFTAPISKYTDGSYPPGDYEVTIRGTTVAATTPRTGTTTFILTLVDPCDPPTSLTAPVPGFEDQEYTLFDSQQSYQHPDFVIDPPECKYTVTYEYIKLSDGRTAVTQDATTDAIHYFQWPTASAITDDLDPLD